MEIEIFLDKSFENASGIHFFTGSLSSGIAQWQDTEAFYDIPKL